LPDPYGIVDSFVNIQDPARKRNVINLNRSINGES